MPKKAILLLEFGAPQGAFGILSFLFCLFREPEILPLPWGARHLLAGAIALGRWKKARALYAKMGGASPLLINTRAFAKALEEEKRKAGEETLVVFGMVASPPSIRHAARQVAAAEPESLVLLPLFPQFSFSTTGIALRQARTALAKEGVSCPIREITSFEENDGFLKALCQKTKPVLAEAARFGAPCVLYSAHGLPARMVAAGDPYPDLCQKTATALQKKLGREGQEDKLCFQSRLGPVRWIGPETEALALDAARLGRPIVIIPLSFLSENLETLVEIGQDLRTACLEAGAPFFGKVETAGAHSALISALARETSKRRQSAN